MAVTFALDGRRLKLGVVANEFFDVGYSRMGGFGWAARQVSRLFGSEPDLGVDVALIDAKRERGEPGSRSTLHGVPLVARPEDGAGFVQRLREQRFDLLLSIDYRENYRAVFRALPRVPILVWARDPRGPAEAARVASVRLPGAEALEPTGLHSMPTRSMAQLVSRWWWGRRIVFGIPSLSLRARAAEAYALPDIDPTLLPNILDPRPRGVVKSERPSVVFLSRLDTHKRPWLFAALARHFPEVEFRFLGRSHHGPNQVAWRPVDLPPNVRLLGHVDGERKLQLLSEAWALVNTSVHEGLAVSFLEALQWETPLLSCVDTEQVASRFGVYVGRYDGTGLEAIPAFVAGLRLLLTDHARRTRMGMEGSEWVGRTHNRDRFLDSFHELCVDAGVSPGP